MVGIEFKGAFRGETRRSLRSGFGVYQYPNPFFRYEGTWQDGKKHGFGKLLFGDGSYYQGEFSNNEIIGQGTRYFASSSNTYTGHFYYGEMDGHGRLKLGNGDCYEGDFKANHFEGEGSYLSHDKQLYSGHWHKHRRHGYGEQTYLDGSRYTGDWVGNKRHGFGKLSDIQDGSTIYEGSWRDDLMHGEGTYTIGDSYTYRNAIMVNNYPIGWPFRLLINEQSNPTISLSNEPIVINVDVINSAEESERVEADSGRLFRLRCGRKTDQPTENSVPTPFGFHVDLVSRNLDPLQSSSTGEISTSEETQTVSDSMLTASDCGRAQFVGIQINTFAIRPASSIPSSASPADALSSSSSSSLRTGASTKTSRKVEKPKPAQFVFIIDDITDPIPFNKALEATYMMIQLSSTDSAK